MAGELNDDGDDEIQHNDGMGSNKRSRQSYGVGQMEIDESSLQGRFSENNKLVKNIGKVVRYLRNLGFTSMTEDAYASAIFLLLKVKNLSFVQHAGYIIPFYFPTFVQSNIVQCCNLLTD